MDSIQQLDELIRKDEEIRSELLDLRDRASAERLEQLKPSLARSEAQWILVEESTNELIGTLEKIRAKYRAERWEKMSD